MSILSTVWPEIYFEMSLPHHMENLYYENPIKIKY